MTATLTFIGHIETPYATPADCPNNVDPAGPACRVVLEPKYADGLTGLRSGDKVMVLYWFEHVDRDLLIQRSHRGDGPVGVFRLRSPHRPNPIAVAELPIAEINDGVLTINGLDCVNGTKLLDIKPVR